MSVHPVTNVSWKGDVKLTGVIGVREYGVSFFYSNFQKINSRVGRIRPPWNFWAISECQKYLETAQNFSGALFNLPLNLSFREIGARNEN